MMKSTIDVHLGARLQRLHDERHMSLSKLSRRIGTTFQQMKKYEAGENRICASTLYRLAELLRVDVSEFFNGLPGQPARQEAEASPSAMLDQIEDAEIRRHLGGLLQALDSRR